MHERTVIFGLAPLLRCIFGVGLMLACASLVFSCTSLSAQDRKSAYPPAYDGIQAGQDAYAYWESRRRDAVNRQLGWNELYKWRAAADQPNTLYYDPYVPYAGAYGTYNSLSGWPYGYGRIYGYGFYDPVPQPIGRRQVQTGPNRWESFPVYADDVVESPPAVGLPRPPLTSGPDVGIAIPRPADLAPSADEALPPPEESPLPPSGAREF